MEPESQPDEAGQTEPAKPVETQVFILPYEEQLPATPWDYDEPPALLARRLNQFHQQITADEDRMKEERDGGPETLPRTAT